MLSNLCKDLRIQRQMFGYATNWTCLLVQDLASLMYIEVWRLRMDEETEKEVKCKFCLIYKYFRWKIDRKVVEARYLKSYSRKVIFEDYCGWSNESLSSTSILKFFTADGNHLFTLKMENYLSRKHFLKMRWKYRTWVALQPEI